MQVSFCKLLGTALAAFVASVTYARADEPVPMIRVTCVPEISLFQLETFGLYNIPKIPKGLEASNGLYTLEDFVATAPVSCRIKSGDLRIDVLQYHSPAPRGECGGEELASLAIKLNGREIDRVDDTHGGCPWNDFKFYGHKITATQYQLTHCRSDFDTFDLTLFAAGSAVVETSCKKILFPAR